MQRFETASQRPRLRLVVVVHLLLVVGVAVVADGQALLADDVDLGDLGALAVEDAGDLLEGGAAGKIVSERVGR